MNPLETVGQKILGVSKALTLMEERHKRQEEDDKELRREVSELRQRLAELITRVAVLEEGRKTVAAEVKAALTETISTWELKKMREQLDEERHKQLPPTTKEKKA